MLRNRLITTATVSAILLWIAAAASGDESKASPFAGAWVMNAAKSQFQEGAPLTSYTATVGDAGAGKLHAAVDWAFADGTKGQLSYTTTLDGHASPVTGYSGADAVRAKMLNPNSMSLSFSKAGKKVEWGTYTVSADGKTMHGEEHGAKDEKGNGGYRHSIIFDRQ